MTHPFFDGTLRPRVFAHRGLVTAEGGASGVWENTAAAFASAHAAGVEYVETDSHVSADGDTVLIHDSDLARLNGDRRAVSEIRTRELRAVFADHGGLLTVPEALDAFPDLRFNIDVKADAAAVAVGEAVAQHADRVLLTSFSDARRRRALAAALEAGAPHRPATSAGARTVAALMAITRTGLSPARLLRDVDALQIPERQGLLRVLTPALIRAARRHDVEIHVWTVNDAEEMTRIIGAGADGIVSDRADVALRVLRPV
ncbi:glycerophosphodiester phosphodiesterase family protein [Microbacterium sp.]|uniref:glycerophosphodiester phosphodiesterase family protein n=1 Tax=Microbacterium sp. TaxID=51671 RepID=UPI0039E654A6